VHCPQVRYSRKKQSRDGLVGVFSDGLRTVVDGITGIPKYVRPQHRQPKLLKSDTGLCSGRFEGGACFKERHCFPHLLCYPNVRTTNHVCKLLRSSVASSDKI